MEAERDIIYTDFVSDQSLDVIRANECEHDRPSLTTHRFRRFWNEIGTQRARAEKAEAEVSTLLVKLAAAEKALEDAERVLVTNALALPEGSRASRIAGLCCTRTRKALSQLRVGGPSSLQKAGERDG